jgi:WD40 repeat protein
MRQVLRGHTDEICGAVEMDDGTIVSYAEDGTIKLWKPATGECVRTLVEPVAAEGLDP